jgi:CheY-specific phosphatase CheX
VGELLNMQNGLFLMNMSNNGVELDMDPQFVDTNRTLSGMKSAYCIPINTHAGKFDFIISEADPTVI